MNDPRRPAAIDTTEDDFADLESTPTSRADLESAGRSCMALLIVAGLILIVLIVWFGLHALGVVG